MARIAGIDLPREKRIEVGIRSIYGIGPARSKEILAATGVNPDTRVRGPDGRRSKQAQGLYRQEPQGGG